MQTSQVFPDVMFTKIEEAVTIEEIDKLILELENVLYYDSLKPLRMSDTQSHVTITNKKWFVEMMVERLKEERFTIEIGEVNG